MTHVVTEACVKHKYQDCVVVCPVEAFREADDYLVIDPDECIDCNLCVPECPVDAILPEDDLTEEQMHFIDLNASLSQEWPMITSSKSAPDDADNWKDKPDKMQYLEK